MDYGTIVNNLNKRIWGAIKDKVHTAFPAILDSYNQETGLARVIPQIQYITEKGEFIDYPPLNGVPVVFPQGMAGNATIAYPIKHGDGCLVICAEQCLDLWKKGHQTGNNLRFSISNAMCIVGMFCKPNETTNEAINDEAVIIDINGSRVKVKEEEIKIKSQSIKIEGNLSVEGNIASTGDVVAGSISTKNHTHIDSEGGSTSKPN